jgi:hypothetical protein
MKVLIFTILLSAIHFTWAGNRVQDLFRKSKRKNKIQWMLFILMIPIIGVLIYNLTMRRQRILK